MTASERDFSCIKIPSEVYSRVSGYFRPVDQWNKAKQEEFHGRKFAQNEQVNKISMEEEV